MKDISPAKLHFKVFSCFVLLSMLLFFAFGCEGKKSEQPEAENDADLTDYDFDTVDYDDDETEDEEDLDRDGSETVSEPDNDSDTESDNDQDFTDYEEDKPFSDPCLEEPCKNVKNSTGECLTKGKTGDYVCVCEENFVWFPNKKTCEPRNSFKGLSCTGQTKCYDNEKEIPCPKAGEAFFGQDANYAENRSCLPQNFTIKSYEFGNTVIDNNSGLEWIQKVFTNENEAIPCKPIEGENSDWRISLFNDLNSIVDSGTFDPTINEIYFPNTPSEFFFHSIIISSICVGRYMDPVCTDVYGIDFKTGLSSSYTLYRSTQKTNFRCVRNTSERTQSCALVFSSDDYEIASFPYQRLLVAKPEFGKNWKEALEYCENLTYAGISDWRLPNRNETYFAESAKSHLVDIFSDYWNSEYFRPWWSSTSYVGVPTKAITSSIEAVQAVQKTEIGNVMCVASDPCSKGEMWNGENCVSSANIAFNNTDNKCGCIEGYTLENSQCVKTCSDDLCKDKAHSTGLCLQTIDDGESQKVQCQCEKNYFLNENSECINPCDADPCSGKEEFDGSCVPTGLTSFTCGCSTGYYPKSNNCIPVNYNDCYTDYNDDACINDVADIMWSSISDSILTWKDAKKHCDDLDEAGYTDWRLPKVEELWTFARSCNNIPKESCEASESKCCLSEECISQCKCKIYPEPNPIEYLWSSSFKQDDPKEVIVFYKYYAILKFLNIKTDAAKVKCVRNLE